MNTSNILNEEHEDILIELINIGFGQAVSLIAELLGRFIQIKVPELELLAVENAVPYLSQLISNNNDISIIKQSFYSQFSGDSLLILNVSSSVLRELLDLDDGDELEQKDAILEVGNILISACVGRLADLLKVKTNFSPPGLITFNQSDLSIKSDYTKDTKILLIRTCFSLEKTEFKGVLLLVLKEKSMNVLMSGINELLNDV